MTGGLGFGLGDWGLRGRSSGHEFVGMFTSCSASCHVARIARSCVGGSGTGRALRRRRCRTTEDDMNSFTLRAVLAASAFALTAPIAAQPPAAWDKEAFWAGAPAGIEERLDFLQ